MRWDDGHKFFDPFDAVENRSYISADDHERKKKLSGAACRAIDSDTAFSTPQIDH